MVAKSFGVYYHHIPVVAQGEGIGNSWAAPLVGNLPEELKKTQQDRGLPVEQQPLLKETKTDHSVYTALVRF